MSRYQDEGFNRDELRALQDEFLALSDVQEYPEDRPLFGPGSPTKDGVRAFLQPVWRHAIKWHVEEVKEMKRMRRR